ncbi:hypothetical protein ACHHYP_04568 [Achlya hypogyna]|uniref:Uncharacterized protein n=1 Tax=Achlya hypogyna TaxID=1202772 RepID=A0A1V9Z192_ACHHY|nr:hypothetical protein ACHHYP_04568 [Achlya hypogyna]
MAPWCPRLLAGLVVVAAADRYDADGPTPPLQASVLGLPVWAWILLGCALLALAGYGLFKHLDKKGTADELPTVYVAAETAKATPFKVLADTTPVPMARPVQAVV